MSFLRALRWLKCRYCHTRWRQEVTIVENKVTWFGPHCPRCGSKNLEVEVDD